MWGAIAALLLLPLVAMQFTDEVAWTGSDFVAAGVLLIGAGSLYEIAVRVTAKAAHRVLIGAVLLAAVAIIWLEGAVGIF